MRMRFSITTLAGISRTDVAVGIVSDSSMFLAVRAPTPRSLMTSSRPESAPEGVAASACA